MFKTPSRPRTLLDTYVPSLNAAQAPQSSFGFLRAPLVGGVLGKTLEMIDLRAECLRRLIGHFAPNSTTIIPYQAPTGSLRQRRHAIVLSIACAISSA